MQSETVVTRDKVDAVVGRTPILPVEIGRAGEPPTEIRELAAVAFIEATHRVAKASVPLRPVHRKIADLIRADVPRLSDQNRAIEYRILCDGVEERTRRPKRAAFLATEHRGKIESEPVHVHRLDPVTQ